MMPAVPRVLNRLHDKIVQGALAAGGLKTKLFVRACEAKVGGVAGDAVFGVEGASVTCCNPLTVNLWTLSLCSFHRGGEGGR